MKKLLLGLFTIAGLTSFAQLDLSVTSIISPANGSTVADLAQTPSKFVVTNVGTTTLAAGDTIFFRNELNATTQTYVSGGNQVNVFIRVLPRAVGPNDTVSATITLPIAWSNAGVSSGSSFTWGFNVRGTTCCPTVNDQNTANDVAFVTLNASGTVGIEEEIESIKPIISLSRGNIIVSASNVTSSTTVEVFDLVGKQILSGKLGEGEVVDKRFNLTNATSGIYLVVIKDGNSVITTQKVMK